MPHWKVFSFANMEEYLEFMESHPHYLHLVDEDELHVEPNWSNLQLLCTKKHRKDQRRPFCSRNEKFPVNVNLPTDQEEQREDKDDDDGEDHDHEDDKNDDSQVPNSKPCNDENESCKDNNSQLIEVILQPAVSGKNDDNFRNASSTYADDLKKNLASKISLPPNQNIISIAEPKRPLRVYPQRLQPKVITDLSDSEIPNPEFPPKKSILKPEKITHNSVQSENGRKENGSQKENESQSQVSTAAKTEKKKNNLKVTFGSEEVIYFEQVEFHG